MAASMLVGLLGEASSSHPWKKAAQQQLLPPLCAAVLAVAIVAWCAARAAEWAWLRPRRLERALRAQGIRGTAYRPLAGDAPLSYRLASEARSRAPLPPGCHAIVPRAMPLVHHTMNEHGKNSVTWFGPTPRVIITKPDLVRQVLSNKFGHFERADGFGQVTRLLHYGLSIHEGSKWAKHRRIINPAFHLHKLKRMLPAFASCCADLVSRWEGLVAAADDGEPCEVDVWPEMQRLTGDVISRVAFGSSYLEGRRIFELQEEQVHLAMLVANKIHIPGYMMLPTRVNRRMKRIAAEIEGILRGMIATRESSLRAGKETSDDLLGLLLESNMERSGAPAAAAAVTMVLYEVLRLYMPVSALHRRTYKPMELGGVRYPAGVILTLPLLSIHHDKDVWGPDADEFRPDRFAEGIARAASSGGDAPPAFFPFGWGPRSCIGQTFALLEAKIGLAMILGKFAFELSPSYAHAPVHVALVQPEHGAQVKLRKLP
ncbi:hypothetical protein SORBI_3003G109766 [Sorghum bicolor]|uniref:Cytochrome P450 n=1 Tax=Sorghum bicolor TaxID=4558 RepID=A0A1W0VWT7_SORBI|nr:hypothetical protein SORBI_3003G109766 [Sorghum bicolor]